MDGVGIGITAPDESAVLEIHSPTGTEGVLIPRIPDRNNVSNPADGLMLIDSTDHNFYQYNGLINSWQAVFPRGGIIMWSGTNPPSGWALCNGGNGTPDLRGRFIISYDNRSSTTPRVAGNNDINYGAIGNVGGSTSVSLSPAEMPAHSHTGITDPSGDHTHSASFSAQYIGARGKTVGRNSGGGEDGADDEERTLSATVETDGSGDHTHTFTTSSTGSGNAHENRPPYYVLAFIMKL